MPDQVPVIAVNFSHVDEDGLIFAGVEDATGPLNEGIGLLATDYEGHECRGRIEKIEGRLAFLALDWDSWTVTETTGATYLLEAMNTGGNGYGSGGSVVESERTAAPLVPAV
jgi:hypothetical protein